MDSPEKRKRDRKLAELDWIVNRPLKVESLKSDNYQRMHNYCKKNEIKERILC